MQARSNWKSFCTQHPIRCESSTRGITRKTYGHNERLADLLRQGESGLQTAIERFDPSKGFAFSTYATWWIKQEIIRGNGGGNANVREPRHSLPSSGGTSVTA
ncbi:MAG: sigma factor [Acidimicrobiales bacterium]